MTEIPPGFAPTAAGLMHDDSLDQSYDATGTLDPAAFNWDDFVSGIRPTVRAVRIYGRPDLRADMDVLTDRLHAAQATDAEDRALTDESPASIRQQMQQIAAEFEASGVVFKVEARTDKRIADLKTALKDQDVTDEDDVELHLLADAVIEPAGVTVGHLRALRDVSEVQIKMLAVARTQANYQAPRVDVPFSSEPSKPRQAQR